VQKRTQKITVSIIIAIISITLIGSSFVAMFQPEPQSGLDENQAALEREYQQRKETVATLSKKLEGNQQDIETKIALGNAYYDKSRVTGQLNINEYHEDLQKAIQIYQDVLAVKEDNLVRLKLATSAFLYGDGELAEKTYLELIKSDPQNVEALYGYGVYLFYEKEDPKQAEEMWQKAKALTSDEQIIKRLDEMINRAQGININPSAKKDK
jgi:tetratricopeptide (TPR) repeat protein